MAETCVERGQLAASFFFSRSSQGRNARENLFPTIAFQISMSSPHQREKLRSMLQNDPYIIHRVSGSIDLLVALFCDMPGTPPDGQAILSPPALVIIDGLDGCQGNNDQSVIFPHVCDLVNKHRLPLLILITSRPESHIRDTFDEPVMRRVAEVFFPFMVISVLIVTS